MSGMDPDRQLSPQFSNRTKAVVLMSGGIDSTLCAAIAIERWYAIRPLVISYGQRNDAEIDCALDIAHWFGAATQTNLVKLDTNIFTGSTSTLLSDTLQTFNLERGTYTVGAPRDRQVQGEVSSAVPFRNGMFIAMATAYALSCGADTVFVGTTGEGASQYADCDEPFIDAITEAVTYGSGEKVNVTFPLKKMSKLQIVELAIQEWRDGKLPLQLTRSCYDSGPLSCGTCLACEERLAAFKQLGVKDPIRYAKPSIVIPNRRRS